MSSSLFRAIAFRPIIAVFLAAALFSGGWGCDSQQSASSSLVACYAVPAAISATQPAPRNATPIAAQRATTTAAAAPSQAVALRAYVLHLPGVSGESGIDHTLIRGLAEGLSHTGIDAHFDIYDWTCNDPGVPALRAYARNRSQAAIVAARLTRIFRADPLIHLVLISHSGGAGPAVWALELLPPDVKIDSLVLLAPALSPKYDLTAALRHVRGRAYVFFSDLDRYVLGAGTRVFGTIDGVYSNAAGYVGFTPPATADFSQYQKLIQCPYQADWLRWYNDGDHIGPTSTPFAREVIAPLLVGAILADSQSPSLPRASLAPALASPPPFVQPRGATQ